MNNTDRLFKDKLAEHSLTPRPQAWEKLEGQLTKKNKSILWMRLAAAVAIVGLLTFVIMNRKLTTTGDLAKSTTPVVPQPEVKQAVPEPVVANPADEKQSAPSVLHKKEVAPANKSIQEEIPAISQTITPIETIAQAETEKVETEQIESIELVEKPVKKSIVLVYELPTIAAAAPTQPAAVETVVVTGDEKQTGIQKILETAKEVKNSDNPWGELREAKNELLALDFKKDKNRNQ